MSDLLPFYNEKRRSLFRRFLPCAAQNQILCCIFVNLGSGIYTVSELPGTHRPSGIPRIGSIPRLLAKTRARIHPDDLCTIEALAVPTTLAAHAAQCEPIPLRYRNGRNYLPLELYVCTEATENAFALFFCITEKKNASPKHDETPASDDYRLFRNEICNRLLAIQYLLRDEKNEDALRYIDATLDFVHSRSSAVHTSFSPLRAALEQQITNTRADGIYITYSVAPNLMPTLPSDDILKVCDALFCFIRQQACARCAFNLDIYLEEERLISAFRLRFPDGEAALPHAAEEKQLRAVTDECGGTLRLTASDGLCSGVLSLPNP